MSEICTTEMSTSTIITINEGVEESQQIKTDMDILEPSVYRPVFIATKEGL